MTNPVIVELFRGDHVESCHTGAVAVADPKGKLVFAVGDVDRPVFLRSAVKAFQALPLLESGAADHLGLTEAEIALAVSSHGGEARHVDGVRSMLAKAGRDVTALECGEHRPTHSGTAEDLVRSGQSFSSLHNGCSGKHAGFICLASSHQIDPQNYINANHPVMREVMAAVSDMSGARLQDMDVAIDGCSMPAQAISLVGAARGFARFGTGAHLQPQRARAATRIRVSVAANPFMVAGTGRFCTSVMSTFRERAFVKAGAEGVFGASFPELGYGVALKCDDGTMRAAEAMMAAVIAKLLATTHDEMSVLAPFLSPVYNNWRGIRVGGLRAVGELA